jgi:hypothetical protein
MKLKVIVLIIMIGMISIPCVSAHADEGDFCLNSTYLVSGGEMTYKTYNSTYITYYPNYYNVSYMAHSHYHVVGPYEGYYLAYKLYGPYTWTDIQDVDLYNMSEPVDDLTTYSISGNFWEADLNVELTDLEAGKIYYITCYAFVELNVGGQKQDTYIFSQEFLYFPNMTFTVPSNYSLSAAQQSISDKNQYISYLESEIDDINNELDKIIGDLNGTIDLEGLDEDEILDLIYTFENYSISETLEDYYTLIVELGILEDTVDDLEDDIDDNEEELDDNDKLIARLESQSWGSAVEWLLDNYTSLLGVIGGIVALIITVWKLLGKQTDEQLIKKLQSLKRKK